MFLGIPRYGIFYLPPYDSYMLDYRDVFIIGSKDDIMKNKKIGIGFGVKIVKDGKVLLGRRHDDPEKADSALRGEGTWTMPGGKLHYGESFEEGACREVKEETGLVLKDVRVICVNNDNNKHAHFVTLGLFSDSFDGEPDVMEPDEITEWRWFGMDELPQKIFTPSQKILKNFKLNSFYLKQ